MKPKPPGSGRELGSQPVYSKFREAKNKIKSLCTQGNDSGLENCVREIYGVGIVGWSHLVSLKSCANEFPRIKPIAQRLVSENMEKIKTVDIARIKNGDYNNFFGTFFSACEILAESKDEEMRKVFLKSVIDLTDSILESYKSEKSVPTALIGKYKRNFFNSVFLYGDSEQKRALDEKFARFIRDESVDVEKRLAIAVIYFLPDGAESKSVYQESDKIFQSLLSGFGLAECPDILIASKNCVDVENLSGFIFANLESIRELYAEDPDAPRFLYDNFGIVCFNRYTKEILLAQKKEAEDKKNPYVLVVYPRYDHDNAFANSEMMSRLYKSLPKNMRMRVTEASDLGSAVKVMQKYGDNKIPLLVFGGHGTGDSAQLGRDVAGGGSLTTQNVKDFANQTRGFLAKERKPTIVLLSCRGGVDGGLAQNLSREFKALVISHHQRTGAPEYITYDQRSDNFKVKFFEKGMSVYDNGTWQKGQSTDRGMRMSRNDINKLLTIVKELETGN